MGDKADDEAAMGETSVVKFDIWTEVDVDFKLAASPYPSSSASISSLEKPGRLPWPLLVSDSKSSEATDGDGDCGWGGGG